MYLYMYLYVLRASPPAAGPDLLAAGWPESTPSSYLAPARVPGPICSKPHSRHSTQIEYVAISREGDRNISYKALAIHTHIHSYMHISEVGGKSVAAPTGKSFRFVSCVRTRGVYV